MKWNEMSKAQYKERVIEIEEKEEKRKKTHYYYYS